MALGTDELVLEVRGEQARRGDDARVRRDEHARDLEFERDVAGKQRAGTAGGDQREVARVVAAAYRVDLDVLRHAELLDLQGAEGGLLRRHVDLTRELLDHRLGELGLEREATANESALGTQAAEEDLGVGRRGVRTTAVVTGGARIGTGRLRTDAEDATLVDVRDRAATGTDGVDVDHRHHRLVIADLRVEQVAHAHLATSGHADVGGGAADVEGDDAVVARHLAGPNATDQARHGARHQQVDGATRGRLDRRHAAGRLHELHAVLEAGVLHRGREAIEVRGDLGADERVEGDGGEALVLAVQRDHVARDRLVRLGKLFRDDLGHAVLMRAVEVRVQEADRNSLDARLLEQAHLAANGVLIERRDDLAVRRGHALGDDTAVAALDERARLPR